MPGRIDGQAAAAAQPLSILLVEDEDIIRLSSVDMLQELGHLALGAGNSDEALALLRQRRVDVLITDIQLPGRSGFELADEARALHPDIGVIYASGRDSLHGEREGGILLRKPYDLAAVVRSLQMLGKVGGR